MFVMDTLRICSYNFNLKIKENFKRYILDILQQQFNHFENIESVVISLKTYDDKNPESNCLNPLFFISNEAKYKGNSLFNTLSKSYREAFIGDDEKFLGFYKNALNNESVLVVTKRHNQLYKSMEKKVKGCVVIDYDTIKNYQKISSVTKTVKENINDNKKEIKKLVEKIKKDNDNTDKDINALDKLIKEIPEIEKIDIFEELFLIPRVENWTVIIFPYYFLSQFIGIVSVAFKGGFDINVLENYIEFLRYAKTTFYVGIINHIIDDWINNNDTEDKSFIDLIKYFLPLEELTENKNYYEPFLKNSNQTEQSIFTPLIRENNNKYLPLLLKYNNSAGLFYKVNKPINSSKMEIRDFTFSIISHIQWLWQHWMDKTNKTKKV
jgi:hypothetical protein